ncbi:alpha-glucosidase C-terminal domain-containing protein, partial [Cupriavidus sp. IK-TO18]
SDGKPWLPIPPEHRALAVDRQQRYHDSVLARYRAVLAARRAHPSLVHGAISLLDADGDVLAFVREAEGERLLCVFNFAEQAAWWPIQDWAGQLLSVDFPGAEGDADSGRIALPPLGYFIGRFV